MPKYVCDFDEVKNIGKNIGNVASDINKGLTTYSSSISNDLSGWNSPAKSSFTTVNEAQVTKTQAEAEFTNKLGDYIQKAAQEIQSLDEDLAARIKI